MKRESSIFLLVVIIFTGLILYFNYEKDCGQDSTCFDSSASSCSRAKYTTQEDNNILEYKILGKEEGSCQVRVTILQVDPEADFNTIQQFEGKSMTCLLPEITSATESKDIINYCTGPLKEAMYELIIQKLYNYVAQNIGDIISELKATV